MPEEHKNDPFANDMARIKDLWKKSLGSALKANLVFLLSLLLLAVKWTGKAFYWLYCQLKAGLRAAWLWLKSRQSKADI